MPRSKHRGQGRGTGPPARVSAKELLAPLSMRWLSLLGMARVTMRYRQALA